MESSSRDTEAQAALKAGPEAIRAYLKAYDTEGFGCACLPPMAGHVLVRGWTCGPCCERERQKPLWAVLAAPSVPAPKGPAEAKEDQRG